jgi:cytochrome oxidase Cu insertion factor (SCO1/SenC/PrrC family)
MSSAPPSPESPPGTPRPNRRRFRVASILLGVVAAGVIGTVLALTTGSSTPSRPATFAVSLQQSVPRAVDTLSFLDQRGRRTTLASFKGRVVVLADFLTSCQDECPISTGAFLTFERHLRADGLTSKVSVVEVTVDPGRDTVARLAAYEKYTGVDWTLLTGSQSQIDTFWKYFGASYDKVSETASDTAALDWATGKPYTYDMDHSNNVYLFDVAGHERLITEGLPSIGKTLPTKLRSLLSPLGITHLDNPGFGAWTEADLRAATGALLGQTVRATP